MIAQLWTAVLLGIAAVGAGAGVTAPLARRITMPTATRIALIGANGLAYIGVVTLVVGHLRLLGAWLPYALAASGVLLGVFGRAELGASVAQGWRGIRTQFLSHPVPLTAVSICLGIAAAATLVPPTRRDEIDYHWPAPVAWAAEGGWSDSPFRHVDAFPFMEIIYTAAATQESYVAAHLLHFGAFVSLGFAVAGVATTMGVRGTGVTATAALAMPVVWDSAYTAYNDTPVALLGMCAVGVTLAAPPRSLAAAAVSGALIAVGTSIKPTGIAAAGVVGLIILMRYFFDRSAARAAGETRVGLPSRDSATRFSTVLLQWTIVALPALATIAFWSARQYLYTGNLIDPAVTAEPDDYALTMLPDALEQALAPLLPFVSGVVGALEPWGGQTAFVLQLLLVPAIVYAVWRRGEVLRRFALMLVPAWAHWIVLGFAIVRTRFHILSWVMMVVAVRIATEDAADRYPKLRIWLELAWTACILIGLVDVSFEMFRHFRLA